MTTNAVQSTYSSSIAAGFPGMIANAERGNRISRTVEDAAGIAFGKAAFRGAGDHGCTATPATGTFLGITIETKDVQPVPGGVAADIYPQYATAPLLNEGVIFVTAGSNTTDGADVYVTPAGVFTATSAGNTLIPAKFEDTVSSGAVCRIRVVS